MRHPPQSEKSRKNAESSGFDPSKKPGRNYRTPPQLMRVGDDILTLAQIAERLGKEPQPVRKKINRLRAKGLPVTWESLA